MGYEVIYKYYDRKEEGGYDTEEIKELKKKVGNSYDDVPYEKLAALIMGQLARRDIMIFDAEIYEYAKKKISFKESNGGIIIKGRKYSYDSPDTLPEVVETEAQSAVHPHENQPVPTALTLTSNNVNNFAGVPKARFAAKNAPIRYEYFEPHKDLVADFKRRGLKLTIGQKYPIYEERPDSRGLLYGMLYVTRDDEGNKQILSDKLFVFRAQLEGGSQFQDTSNPALEYTGLVDDFNVPALR